MFFFILINFLIFIIGIWGIYSIRRNLIIILLAIEVLLLSVNLNYIYISIYLDDMLGQMISLYILTIAACESAIGLAILIVYYRFRQHVNIRFLNILKS